MPEKASQYDETRTSEITIAPDGRIYVFGISRQLLDVLDDLNLADPDLRRRAEHLRALETPGAAAGQAAQDRTGVTRPAVPHPETQGEPKP